MKPKKQQSNRYIINKRQHIMLPERSPLAECKVRYWVAQAEQRSLVYSRCVGILGAALQLQAPGFTCNALHKIVVSLTHSRVSLHLDFDT